MNNYRNNDCINCGGRELSRFIDLGEQPNGNRFPTIETIAEEPFFPFAMAVCLQCWQVQLEAFPSPEFMFRDHSYITGMNKPVVRHFQKLSKSIVEKYNLQKNSLVIDIGCNDGTLLQSFAELGMRTLGVDPGSITGGLCEEKGINVCRTFWNKATGESLSNLNLIPSVITATAVFYHIPDLHDFVCGLRAIMNNQTVFITQCVYLKDVIEKNQFDHFYHEHTMIHSLAPLKRLFVKNGMRVIDIEFDSIHGGSFILHAALNASTYPTATRVKDALIAEQEAKLNNLATFTAFSRRVESNKYDLLALLNKLNEEGKTVYGLCAPAKGSTLLNYAKIGPELVEKVVEINPYKIGKLTPGTHIPIIDEKKIAENPDYYLILSWNFLDFFVDKYRDFLNKGGKFIVTNPVVRVIDDSFLTSSDC